MSEKLKINLGSGDKPLEGYRNLDRKDGFEAYPLTGFDDNSVDEVRASHLLEHFPHGQVFNVLKEWVRVLKPGGVLRVAVPDFAVCAQAYLNGADFPVQGIIMGGQVDQDDFHATLFDEGLLRSAMQGAGLRGISRWQSEVDDCAALPVSLNLMGVKPGGASIGKVSAVMSVPRLGFMDNFFAAQQAFGPLGISMRKVQGAFWGQCLERAMDEVVEEGADWILTLDYDTVFTRNDVEALLSLAARHPEADAIAPVQGHRIEPTPLMTMRGEDGKNRSQVTLDEFSGEITKVNTAHFGLTLINTAKLRELPRPWFWSKPGSDGKWDLETGREDDDIYFWHRWEEAGNSLYLANRIPVGHLELMVRWPDKQFKPLYQHSSEFWKEGPPEDVWQ